MIDPVEVDLAGLKTIADGLAGKARVVLLAGESLLLSGRDDAAVLDKGSRAVVVEGGNAEESHGSSSV